MAEGLEQGEASPDEDEFVELLELTWDQVEERLEAGAIQDGKTLVALQYWQLQRLKRRLEA